MGETRILIRFLRSIFHGTGNSARFCQNFGIISGGLNPPNPPSGYASVRILQEAAKTKEETRTWTQANKIRRAQPERNAEEILKTYELFIC
jgi:hypothetical protein